MRRGQARGRCTFFMSPYRLHGPSRIVVAREWGGQLSWSLRPRCLRANPPRGRVLFAAPWVGEFGWELMNWQAFLRRLSVRYERTIVCCRETSRMLYADFCNDLVFHEIAGSANCHMAHHIQNPEELERVMCCMPADADCVLPLKYVPASEQSFVRFGKPRDDLRTDILIHARRRESYTERNWSHENWDEFIAHVTQMGLSVGAVGLRGSTLDLVGVTDYRNRDLAETVDLMASTKLVAGPSSGPMHLAALCGTPQLVWTNQGRYMMGKTSREKYESWWNPLRAKASVLDSDGFNPSVESVVSQLEALL